MEKIYTYKELVEESSIDIENQEEINKLKMVLSEEDQNELDNFIKNKKSKSEQSKILARNEQREARLDMLNNIAGVGKGEIESGGDIFQLADLDKAKNALGKNAYNILAKHLVEAV